MTEKLKRILLPGLRWNQEIYGATLAQHVTQEMQWLDAGCGHQLLAASLEGIEDQLMKSVRLMVGVDVQFDGSAKSRELPLRVCADLTHLPVRDGKFGLVTSNMVVEHLQDPRTTFQELARVIAPGGLFILHTPNANSYIVCAGRVAKAVLPRAWILRWIRWSESRASEDVFPTFYRANTRRKLQKLLSEAGLKERSCRFLLGPQPLFRRFAPLAAFELVFQRLILFRPFDFLRTTIVAVYQKSGTPEVRSNYAIPALHESEEVNIERSPE